MDRGAAYEANRQRILRLARDADPQTEVRATPGWDLGDLLRHLVGVAADVVDGNTDAYAQPGWTAAQVAQRADASLADLTAEWDDCAPQLADILRDPDAHDRDPFFSRGPLVDIAVHLGDLGYAAGEPSEPDAALVDHLLTGRFRLLEAQLDAAGLPGVEIFFADGGSRRVGEPAASVEADRHDLWRSLHGRRTREQVLAFAWTGDPTPYLDWWPGLVFTFPEHRVEG